MKILKSIFIFLLIVISVIIFLEIIPIAPKYPNTNPWIVEEGERPLIIPHGGAKLLYPENTIYSFEQLDNDGYDVFEIDLCLTKDDILISHHDVTFINDQGEEKTIKDLSYQEIIQEKQNFAIDFVNLENEKPFESPNSEILPKLKPAKLIDLFNTYPDKKYILELKDTVEHSGKEIFKEAVDALLTLIKDKKMENQVIVSSFDDTITKLFQEKSNNSVMTSTATKDSTNFVLYSILKVDFFYRPKDGALILPYKEVIPDSQLDLVKKLPGFIRKKLTTYDKENDIYYTNIVKQSIIDDAHRHNMSVFYWTVNDKDEMIKLINMGVDGIITDRPDLLKEVYEELGI
ncbi:hypothetical protein KHQ81_04420 [Mycoplasmatota bacterium]|nr:hypothetical protein KHQ81_04420 [Mycoplasmatota bacterium]